ncbi:hypothetical protein BV25DRAFT_1773930, partial [Artomyces pyxidatus]
QDKQHKLAASGRPKEVGWWVQRHRVYEKPPAITDVRAYGGTLKGWWASLQPSWRGAAWPLTKGEEPEDENWDKTRKGGANGIVMLVIALAWW